MPAYKKRGQGEGEKWGTSLDEYEWLTRRMRQKISLSAIAFGKGKKKLEVLRLFSAGGVFREKYKKMKKKIRKTGRPSFNLLLRLAGLKKCSNLQGEPPFLCSPQPVSQEQLFWK